MNSSPSTTTNAPLNLVEKSLRDSLHSGDICDIQLYAYSRRTVLPDGSVIIAHPRPIIAIGSILEGTEYFAKLLASASIEHKIPEQTNGSEYDYETDSDLDDAEEVEETPYANMTIPNGLSEPNVQTRSGPLQDLGNTQAHRAASGRAMSIVNVAHRTLKACIFFLYTGKVNFLPITMKDATKRQLVAPPHTSDSLAPACSPKSMYRLAKIFGIANLQELAYAELAAQLTSENIVQEAFSPFYARHERLRELVVSRLSQSRSSSSVEDALPQVIHNIVKVEFPHAAVVLCSLLGLRIARSPPSSPKPSPTDSSVIVQESPPVQSACPENASEVQAGTPLAAAAADSATPVPADLLQSPESLHPDSPMPLLAHPLPPLIDTVPQPLGPLADPAPPHIVTTPQPADDPARVLEDTPPPPAPPVQVPAQAQLPSISSDEPIRVVPSAPSTRSRISPRQSISKAPALVSMSPHPSTSPTPMLDRATPSPPMSPRTRAPQTTQERLQWSMRRGSLFLGSRYNVNASPASSLPRARRVVGESEGQGQE